LPLWTLDFDNDGVVDVGETRNFGNVGGTTEVPAVGDWTGNGVTKLGVFRPSDRRWSLDVNGDGVLNAGDVAVFYGALGDLPVVGDWTGEGITRLGVYRPSTNQVIFDRNGNRVLEACGVDLCLGPFGSSTDTRVAAAW
jgi:hypothetical protein